MLKYVGRTAKYLGYAVKIAGFVFDVRLAVTWLICSSLTPLGGALGDAIKKFGDDAAGAQEYAQKMLDFFGDDSDLKTDEVTVDANTVCSCCCSDYLICVS